MATLIKKVLETKQARFREDVSMELIDPIPDWVYLYGSIRLTRTGSSPTDSKIDIITPKGTLPLEVFYSVFNEYSIELNRSLRIEYESMNRSLQSPERLKKNQSIIEHALKTGGVMKNLCLEYAQALHDCPGEPEAEKLLLNPYVLERIKEIGTTAPAVSWFVSSRINTGQVWNVSQLRDQDFVEKHSSILSNHSDILSVVHLLPDGKLILPTKERMMKFAPEDMMLAKKILRQVKEANPMLVGLSISISRDQKIIELGGVLRAGKSCLVMKPENFSSPKTTCEAGIYTVKSKKEGPELLGPKESEQKKRRRFIELATEIAASRLTSAVDLSLRRAKRFRPLWIHPVSQLACDAADKIIAASVQLDIAEAWALTKNQDSYHKYANKFVCEEEDLPLSNNFSCLQEAVSVDGVEL